MAAKLTRLSHKIVVQLQLLAESCTVCSSRATWLVRKLLDIPWVQEKPRNRRYLRQTDENIWIYEIRNGKNVTLGHASAGDFTSLLLITHSKKSYLASSYNTLSNV
jgi:predicted nucleic acid-binding protein